MAGLKDIKLKIQSVQKTGKVTRAMEAVSAVKMRKSQDRAFVARPYALTAMSVLQRISPGAVALKHPLAEARAGKTAIIVIVSDKGLAGSLNSGVIRAVEKRLEKDGLTKETVVMYSIGKRGAEYFASRGFDVRERHDNISDDVSVEDLYTATQKVLAWHASGEVGRALVAYTNFLSTFEQQPTLRQVIPLKKETIEEIVAGIPPIRGKYASMGFTKTEAPVEYKIEPDPQTVLDVLVPDLVHIAVFHALLESKASEHSARMVAMKNATDKSKEVAKTLNLKYNKARQAAITREVSEIVGGIEAMK